MLVRLIFILSIILCSSCQSDNSKNQYFLDYYSGTVNGLSLINSYNYFRLNHNSYSIDDSCSYTPIHYRQGYFYFDCISVNRFDNLIFKKYRDTVFLYKVQFSRNLDTEVVFPDFIVNSNTTVSDFEKRWPGISDNLSKSAAFPRVTETGIYVDDSNVRINSPKLNLIRFTFFNDTLSQMIYDWRPVYPTDMWNKFVEQKSILDKTGSLEI